MLHPDTRHQLTCEYLETLRKQSQNYKQSRRLYPLRHWLAKKLIRIAHQIDTSQRDTPPTNPLTPINP